MANTHFKGSYSVNKNEVIKLGLQHIDGCVLLSEIALNKIWSKKQWEEELALPSRSCFGIVDKGKLLGLSCGLLVGNQLDITALAVDPLHRRLGLGSRILNALLKEAKSKGITNATLEVKENNDCAILFYQSFNFKKVGYRKKYYKNGCGACLLALYI